MKQLKNLSKPAAYLEVKQTILQCKDSTDIKQVEKMIDRYIFQVCEKPLREERKADLVYMLNWQTKELGLPC